jgi:hypothetical protein
MHPYGHPEEAAQSLAGGGEKQERRILNLLFISA